MMLARFRILHGLLAVTLALTTACLKSPSAPPVQVPTTITLSTSNILLTAIGQQVRIDATVLDHNSKVITDATIFWRSANVSIATVGKNGSANRGGERYHASYCHIGRRIGNRGGLRGAGGGKNRDHSCLVAA